MKDEMSGKADLPLIKIWGPDYNMQPPASTRDDSRYPRHDPRYANLKPEEVPLGESFQETGKRVLSYWHENI